MRYKADQFWVHLGSRSRLSGAQVWRQSGSTGEMKGGQATLSIHERNDSEDMSEETADRSASQRQYVAVMKMW